MRLKGGISERSLRKKADALEDGIIKLFYPEYGAHKNNVLVNGSEQPFTITSSHLDFQEPLYFRAGNLLVLNEKIPWFSEVVQRGFEDNLKVGVNELIEDHPLKVWLHETMDFDSFPGWRTYAYQDFFTGGWKAGKWSTPYTAPWTIGLLLAMQEYARELAGCPFADVGSRNAVIANAAVNCCEASSALAIEKEELPVLSRAKAEPEATSEDIIRINIALNGTSGSVSPIYRPLSEIPMSGEKDFVVAYSMESFGFPYSNAPQRLYDEYWDALSEQDTERYRKVMAELDSFKRPSILEDILDRFPGVKIIIASGGHEEYDENQLLEESEKRGLTSLCRIPIPVLCKDNPLETPAPKNRIIINPTHVFKVGD